MQCTTHVALSKNYSSHLEKPSPPCSAFFLLGFWGILALWGAAGISWITAALEKMLWLDYVKDVIQTNQRELSLHSADHVPPLRFSVFQLLFWFFKCILTANTYFGQASEPPYLSGPKPSNIQTFQQNVSYHVQVTCLRPDLRVQRWRGWWWSCGWDGCLASDHSPGLCFNICKRDTNGYI